MQIYYNAIVVQPVPGEKPLTWKYIHNITDRYIPKFIKSMKRKYPDATHINFYYKLSRKFVKQVQLNEPVGQKQTREVAYNPGNY